MKDVYPREVTAPLSCAMRWSVSMLLFQFINLVKSYSLQFLQLRIEVVTHRSSVYPLVTARVSKTAILPDTQMSISEVPSTLLQSLIYVVTKTPASQTCNVYFSIAWLQYTRTSCEAERSSRFLVFED